MGAGHQSAVMMEARIASTLVVIQTELAFELPVVEFDSPAQAGEPGEMLGLAVFRQVGEPVVGGSLRVLGPLDDEPLGAGLLSSALYGVRGPDPDKSEAAYHLLPALVVR